MTRKPSCLISCSHSFPDVGAEALVGRHGAMKPGGRGREYSDMGRWDRHAGAARDHLPLCCARAASSRLRLIWLGLDCCACPCSTLLAGRIEVPGATTALAK